MITYYLAGPINKKTDAECNDWRNHLTDCLQKFYGVDKVKVLNPMSRDYRGIELQADIVPKLVEGDKEDIDNCNVVIARCDEPSFGTAMEVFYAWEHFKDVIIITSIDKPSPWLVYHSNAIVKDNIEVMKLIEKLEEE